MNPVKLSRRRFLLLAGCGVVAAGGYSYVRGLRFPPLAFAGNGPTTDWKTAHAAVSARGAYFKAMDDDAFLFRAFVPEPVFELRGNGRRPVKLAVENLHNDALLDIRAGGASVDEVKDKLKRTVSLLPAARAATGLSWRFPKQEQFRFAAIGDSGGGTELHWCLKRAAQLGADFLLHLGDIYYEKGDLDRAELNFRHARIPAYSAIGNHDFNDNGHAEYPRFHHLIGPGNLIFTLGGIEFVSFDTAANFFPVERGRRGQILRSLTRIGSDPDVRDRVAFTHKPLTDPDPKRHHAVDRSEAGWLRQQLLAAGTRNLLVGHIHIKDEFDDQGLHTYISGQGLAHADLMVRHAYAEILLGDVTPGKPVAYQWQPLKMPFDWHCNRRNFNVLEALKRTQQKARLTNACAREGMAVL